MNKPEIIETIIPIGKARTGKKHTKKYICVHNTGDENKEGSSEVLSRYLKNIAMTEAKSWHYSVDDKEIYHHVPDNEIAWHAGDGNSENGGNYNSIGVEVSFGSNIDYEKAFDNAAKLVGWLMYENGFTKEAIVQHNFFKSNKYPNGKNCPFYFRRDKRWDEFTARADSYRAEYEKGSHWAYPILEELTAKGIVQSPDEWEDFESYPTKAAVLSLVLKAVKQK